jgi:pimeloyl-ACP methyl ester carboxylesterase
MRPVRGLARFAVALFVSASALLTGCVSFADPVAPIPTELVPAPHPGANGQRDLVIVLPGRGDDVADLRASGIAAAFQSGLPDADVLLAGVTMPYYYGGRMAQRLHAEVVEPARARGYRHVWLAGASMGGMGTLLYERAHPGKMDGLVLLAPFLGERGLIEEIETAGGLAQWNAGPAVAAIDKDNYQREVWRQLQTWTAPGATRPQRVWLAFGREDRLRALTPPLAAVLPADHVLERDGGHAWVVWTPAAREVAAAIARERERKP